MDVVACGQNGRPPDYGCGQRRSPGYGYGVIFVAGFMVFAEGFLRGLEHEVDAVPFVFGVVQMELFGAERAFQGDLVGWEGLGVGAGDHDKGKVAYSLFVRQEEIVAISDGPLKPLGTPTLKDQGGTRPPTRKDKSKKSRSSLRSG